MEPTRPIVDESELVRLFHERAKPRARRRMGVEQEKIGTLASGAPIPYHGANGINTLLERWSERFGFTRVKEGQLTIALEDPTGSITLEPGGQLEFSGQPVERLEEIVRQLEVHRDQLRTLSAELNLRWLCVGFRPFGRLEDVQWMPKGRYEVMREYLPAHGGRLAHEMMKRTATVQVSFDYEDSVDASRKMMTAMALGPLVTALCANSPIVDERPTDYQSYRAAVWQETDPARCGLLPFVFAPKRDLFSDYTEWALDLPMFFVYRHGRYLPAGDMTFRRFVREGFAGEAATFADWDLHLSTVFPDVRLKNYLELRGADAGAPLLGPRLAALWKGILYDDIALSSAWKLVQGLPMEERIAVSKLVPRMGLKTPINARTVREVLIDVLSIAKEGLVRQGDETGWLEWFEKIAVTGRTQADELVEVWRQFGGDRSKLLTQLDFVA